MADLTITITIPDAARGDFLAAYADCYGWTADLGVTRAAFARDKARELVRAPLRAWRRERAEAAALAAVVDVPDGITTA